MLLLINFCIKFSAPIDTFKYNMMVCLCTSWGLTATSDAPGYSKLWDITNLVNQFTIVIILSDKMNNFYLNKVLKNQFQKLLNY